MWILAALSWRKIKTKTTFKLVGLNNLPVRVLKHSDTLHQNNLGWWALLGSLASFPFSKGRDICLPRGCFRLQ